MKRIAILSAVLLSLALLSSCYMMTSRPTATIRVSFAASRAITGQSVDRVRVYLYSYAAKTGAHTLWTFTDTGLSYKEAPYPGEVQVSVPKGYFWKVLVSAGTDEDNGSFSTAWYGSSQVFALTEDTSVAVTNTFPSLFKDAVDLMGKDLNGVRVVGSTLYASSADTLYAGDTSNDLSLSGTMTGESTEGLAVNSLANGFVYNAGTLAKVLFVNTDQGIVPYDPQLYSATNGFDTGFSTNLTDESTGAQYSILQSGALSDNSGIAVFYQRSGGLGGILLTPDKPVPAAGTNDWVDFDLSSYHITDKPIYDFALVTSNSNSTIYGYFATKLGAFRADSSTLFGGSTGGTDLLKYVTFFTVPNNSTIQALAVTGNSETGYSICVGTPAGAWVGTLDTSSGSTTPVSNWSFVEPTAGDAIVKIAASESGYVAMRSKYNLYVRDPSGAVTTYPFFAGLPGELHSMTWDGNTLYLAGSSGLVALPLGTVTLPS